MKSDNEIDVQQASDYDHLAQKYQWYGPEILFGLCYELVKPGDSLLDIGIGTGLCSSLFFKHGLEIYGLDNSDEMLEMCRQKGITTELKKWDFLKCDRVPLSGAPSGQRKCTEMPLACRRDNPSFKGPLNEMFGTH